MQNLEIKARYHSIQQAKNYTRQLGLKEQWTRIQRDIYFNTDRGKLKLRLVQDQPADLIFYNRPEFKGPSISDYFIYTTHEPQSLLSLLEKLFDKDIEVVKTRTLYLYHNVRIHIDDVVNIGQFIEFEAVLGPADTLESSKIFLKNLEEAFKIGENDKIETGYYELSKLE